METVIQNDTLTDTPKITVKELLQAEADLAKSDPMFLVEDEFLSIKTKEMMLSKLKLNPTQKIVLERIKSKLKNGLPVRIWILKARQTGVSTLIESVLYAYTSQKEGINACVIADDIDGSNYIFQMQKLYHEKLDSHLKPEIKHSNEKKLEFAKIHSQVLIDTADNPNAGRKYTYHFVHLSEVAFFPKGLKEIMLGLNQSVPSLPGTMIIGETTANGIGGDFYEEWIRAIEGNSDWEAIFIPWHQHPDYQRPLDKDELYPIEGIRFATPNDRTEFLKGELELIKTLSPQQINWRRWCIVNNCNGDPLKFMQEYPATWQEAFISTGDLYFDRAGLLQQKEKQPLAIGNIVKVDGKHEFREDSNGLFKIYEWPDKESRYIGGGDCAEGLIHGDNSVWVIGNAKKNSVAATYKHKTAPDQFAQDGILLGNYYNNALMAPENKGYGYSVCQDMYKVYGNLYRHIKTKQGVQEQTKDLGFNTNSVTRAEGLSQMAEEIRETAIQLLDKDLIRECWTFVNIDGKAQAQEGMHDDMVISTMIYCMVRKLRPYLKSSVETKLAREYQQRPLPNQGIGFKGGSK